MYFMNSVLNTHAHLILFEMFAFYFNIQTLTYDIEYCRGHALCSCLCPTMKLKMLALYLYTLIIGHNSCNMLLIQNILILQNKLHYFVTKNVFQDKKVKNTTTTKQNIKHQNICRSRELNPGPLAPKADALPLHHRVN